VLGFELKRRRALAVSAGTAIGEATAKALAAEGAHVAALGIDDKVPAEVFAVAQW
jgi:NAD(P)-dependent dehydrogenase (short-subunit alcohol dehydrogenase family)